MRHAFTRWALAGLLLLPASAYAQQGQISGKVTASDGAVLPGVTVEARSSVLPTPRVTVTGSQGEYRLPGLPVGDYTIKFTLSGMQEVTRPAQVVLLQDTFLDVTLGVQSVKEEVTVTATASIVDRDTASIKSSLSSDIFKTLPVGTEYRDLIKLIPGVMYTQDTVRGPSAGGSGQDNIYQFDGVNVTLPLFGTLASEPSSHDISQISTTKGGARAIDFDRSGGFTVDSISRSGTSRVTGLASYQFQLNGMVAALDNGGASRFEQDRTWLTLNLGGPIVPGKAYFYASYYRPNIQRENQANNYGPLPEYESNRNEPFGKVTFTPTNSVLLNASYRYSHRLETGDIFGGSSASTTGTGTEVTLKVASVDGSWVMSDRSHLTFKWTYFANPNSARPDNVSNAIPSTALGSVLPVTTLDTQGRLLVPQPIAGQTAYNAFIQPLIDRYGYICRAPLCAADTGLPTGGGLVGYGLEFNDQDFFRDGGQISYNYILGTAITHELHAGLQWYTESEDLLRKSNGWGAMSVPGGRLNFTPPGGVPTPIFYTAEFSQQSVGTPPIHSEYRSTSIELNDQIRWRRFTFNAGLLMSNDRLYGQDLKEDSSALSGYVYQAGNQYKMYDVGWGKMMQPRVGATWAYDGRNTIYGSFARYNPPASSLPRAASWARNRTTTQQAHFDANGTLFGVTALAASSGKLFVADMTPRRIDEWIIGTARQMTARWSGRIYGRFRSGSHYWEDTNNTARLAPADGGFNPGVTVNGVQVPQARYIEDLTQKLAQIGSGSTYVIAELDGAYMKYQEVTLESEWRGSQAFVRGSYTWSHYYGNFDQDNTTTGNDSNIFIGSSFVADGAGRQLWDMRDGDLRGDRRHMFKLYGYHTVPWVDTVKGLGTATAGVYLIAQSGQPWEQWSYEPYRTLTTSTSDVSRFAEPAGTHRTDGHFQLDLNYTQNIHIGDRANAQVTMDLFNVANSQTGYNIQNQFHLANYSNPRTFYDPRIFRLGFKVQF